MERLKAELEEQTELQEEALDELQKALANPGEDRMDVQEIPSAAHQDWDTLLAEAERVETSRRSSVAPCAGGRPMARMGGSAC